MSNPADGKPHTETRVVLTNVTIVGTQDGTLSPGAALVIEGGRIARIEQMNGLKVDPGACEGACEIDGRGKFIVPGYWDMHAHPFNSPNVAENLSLMLAYGITGVRQMAGSPELLKKRHQGALIPTKDSPELLALPGALLLQSNVGTPQAAVAEVQKQKREGADFIKTIDLAEESFFASLAEAKRQGLHYEGHLSRGVSASRAAREGMHSIEHLGGDSLLVDCSADENAVRAQIKSLAASPSPADANSAPNPDEQAISLASPTLAACLADPTYIARLRHLISTFNEDKCRQLAETLLRHDTWQAPTLIRLRTAVFPDDPAYGNDPDLRYASPAARRIWEAVAERYSTRLSVEAKDTLHRAFELQTAIAALFDRAGVGMLAGSDCGGSVWEIFGRSLHQEFDLLAEAGFSPLKVLQMSTLKAAQFFGREATDGSVEPGRNANLVLLDQNPLVSVRNLHGIHAVIRAGVYYSGGDIHALKENVAERLVSASAAEPR